MIRVKVSSNVKYSLMYSRGSLTERNKAVFDACDELYDEIVCNMSEDRIPVKHLRKIINKVLKEPKRIEITELKSSVNSGENDYIYADKDNISCTKFLGQIVSIPMKGHKLSTLFVPPFLHEMVHAFDLLYNPKYTARIMSALKNDFLTCRYLSCYNKSLYKYEKFSDEQDKENILKRVRKDIKKVFDSEMNASEKVSIIQAMRYDLETELKAFTAEFKFAQKMLATKREILGCYIEDNYTDSLMFPEKIKLLKEIAFDIIKKERKKLANQYGKVNLSEH